MQDHRIVQDGHRISFSCQNYRFRTHLERGFAHGLGNAGGSVIENSLVGTPGETVSLWLEHVVNTREPGETDLYWLMWYDPSGQPTIPASSIFNREELGDMVRELMQFAPA